MHGAKNTTRQSTRNSGCPRRSLFLIGALFVFSWGGCSVEKHYELLNKFFDGVPDPNAPKSFDGMAIAQSSTYSEHKPYIEDACFECHTDPTDMILSKKDSSMCLKCHTDIQDQYPRMHGAVTGNACLMCHNPHISAFPHLLRDEGSRMCLQCHEMEVKDPIPSHVDLDRSCLECHSGHGGDVAFFLLEQVGVEQSVPETQKPKEIDGP